LEKLQETHDVDIYWRAFELRPPDAPRPSPEYMARIEAARPQFYAIAREHYGVTINEGTFGISSRLAHIGARYAADQGAGNAYHEAVLHAYWQEAQRIDEPDVLADIAAGLGLDRDAFLAALEARAGEKAVVDEARQALEAGIQGVPAFLFAERYLVSGAHPADALRGFVDKVETLLSEQ
jgi:predicted DsbA family dithiol-disulfide isomerase